MSRVMVVQPAVYISMITRVYKCIHFISICGCALALASVSGIIKRQGTRNDRPTDCGRDHV